MSNPTCETCRWWTEIGPSVVAPRPDIHYGACQFRDAQPWEQDARLTEKHRARRRTRFANDFCGEHSPKPENKQ